MGCGRGPATTSSGGKKTLLLRSAYDRLGPEDEARLRTLLRRVPPRAGRWTLQGLVVKSGASAEQGRRVEGLWGQTFRAIDSPRLGPGLQAALRDLFKRALAFGTVGANPQPFSE